MLRNPILTSPSLYEQGSHVSSQRLAVDSDPSMDEALARARRVRREQAAAHAEQAADLAKAAGWTECAAGLRDDAARMRQAITS